MPLQLAAYIYCFALVISICRCVDDTFSLPFQPPDVELDEEGKQDVAYGKVENQIQPMAQLAGKMHAQGRLEESNAALEAARQLFREAQKIQPFQAQGYLTLATTMLNANRFDESYFLWKGARKRVGDDQIKAWIDGRMRWVRYGKVSMERDRVYARGQGNLTHALELMDKQLDIYPGSPGLLLDRGTARIMISDVMISERGVSNWTDAVLADFTASHDRAFRAWRAGVLQNDRGDFCRANDGTKELLGSLVHDWVEQYNKEKRGALVGLDFVVGSTTPVQYGANGAFKDWGGYVARFEDVGLSGPDGVIVDEKHCQLFMPSAGSIMNLPMNLQMLDFWGGPPMPGREVKAFEWFDFHRGRLPSFGKITKPRTVSKAAAVVQLADTSHFHALTEVFGRLWLLTKHGVFDDPAVKLVIPKDPRGAKGFISFALNIFAPDLLDSKRVLWWRVGHKARFPDIHLRAKTLFYANWQNPATLGADGGHGGTPRSVLTAVRTSLLVSQPPPAAEERSLILTLRKKDDMRSNFAHEKYLRENLAQVATDATPQLSFLLFDGKLNASATVAQFSKARGIVGVHGGALVNILFCPQDAVLFEIGFKSPFAGHYRHLATALGIKYVLLRLKTDERGMGANDIDMLDPVGAVGTIKQTLLGADGKIDVAASDEL